MRQKGAEIAGSIQEPWVWAALFAGLAAVLLMIVCVSLLLRRLRRTQTQLEAIGQAMREAYETHAAGAEQMQAGAYTRIEETAKHMAREMKETAEEMGRMQQGQMDALCGRMRADGQLDETRMEHLRMMLDRRLTACEERMNSVERTVEARMTGEQMRIDRLQEMLADEMKRMDSRSERELQRIEAALHKQMEGTIEPRLDRMISGIGVQLEQLSRNLAEMRQLAGAMSAPGDRNGGVHPLGLWGEVQLSALLEQMLAPQQYARKAPVQPGGEAVADYVIVMPGQGHEHTVYLPVDASLPMREYAELCRVSRSGSPQEIAAARSLMESAVRMHARRMSEKLIAVPYTTDYAVLFLPDEGLYAQILQADGLCERIQTESRMVVSGPSTFAALLTSLRLGFRSLAIEQRTQEVTALLGAVRTELGGFGVLLSRTQKKLRQASDTIENAQKHSEQIAQRLSEMGEIPPMQARQMLACEEQSEAELQDDEEPW